jgi:hypothetical protein
MNDEKPLCVIRVRPYAGTYEARAKGKWASCTAGPELAACAVARKICHGGSFRVQRVCGTSAENFNLYDIQAALPLDEEGKEICAKTL